MKALAFFYIVIWIFAVCYTSYMLYRCFDKEAIPLFVAFGLLFVIKWIANYKRIKL